MPKFRKRKIDRLVVAANLQEALRLRRLSSRALAAALQKVMPGARGITYASMRALIAAKIASPRIEVLKAIAEILEVRDEWLIVGTGEMTTKRRRRVVKDLATENDESTGLRAHQVLENLGLRYPLTDAALCYLRDCVGPLPERDEQFREIVRELFAGSLSLRDRGVPHAQFVASFYTELSALYLRSGAPQDALRITN